MQLHWWVVGCSITRKTHFIQSHCTFISQSCQFWSSGTWTQRRPSPSIIMSTAYVISLYKKYCFFKVVSSGEEESSNISFLNDKISKSLTTLHAQRERETVIFPFNKERWLPDCDWVWQPHMKRKSMWLPGCWSHLLMVWSYTLVAQISSVKWWMIIIKGWITVITVLLQRQISERK